MGRDIGVRQELRKSAWVAAMTEDAASSATMAR